jgi:hypothetical protein
LIRSTVLGVRSLRGINNRIMVFGKDEGFMAVTAPKEQLDYVFPAALGSKYVSYDPNPQKDTELDFVSKIKLEIKRDKSDGCCS